MSSPDPSAKKSLKKPSSKPPPPPPKKPPKKPTIFVPVNEALRNVVESEGDGDADKEAGRTGTHSVSSNAGGVGDGDAGDGEKNISAFYSSKSDRAESYAPAVHGQRSPTVLNKIVADVDDSVSAVFVTSNPARASSGSEKKQDTDGATEVDGDGAIAELSYEGEIIQKDIEEVTPAEEGRASASTGAGAGTGAGAPPPAAASQKRRRASLNFVTTTRRNSLSPKISDGEPTNMIYHKIRISETWMLVAVILNTAQMSLLLGLGYRSMPPGVFAFLFILTLSVVALIGVARWWSTKSRLANRRNTDLRGGKCTPDDEKDDVPDSAVYAISAAAIIQGIIYAVFTSTTAGNNDHFSDTGFYSQETVLQVLRFASIALLAVHRTLRPANRIDPLRTMLELEVVSVCWDALDGSTLFDLLETLDLSYRMDTSIRVLMCFWYLSVGVRVAMMFFTHLTPMSWGYQLVLPPPLALDPQPTIDRTLQGLRLRALVIVLMAGAEFFAAGIRITLWTRGQLDALQQDLLIKNCMFLMFVYYAYDYYDNTITRQWNTREIFMCIRYPTRPVQLELFRYFFIAFYLLESALLTTVLVNVTTDTTKWVYNLGIDVLLVVFFAVYCRNVHKHEPLGERHFFLMPQPYFFDFPSWLGFILSCVMTISLFAARIPAIYYAYNTIADDDDAASTGPWSYDNTLLIVVLSVVPIALFSMFWSISYMLFRKEYTAAPGNYNAIHDPVIYFVSIATMMEGALDVLSAVSLMALATIDLPPSINAACAMFTLLELANGCQSFMFQVLLSGGQDDTPMDLVKWTAVLRMFRSIIDFGTFILRIVLWAEYNAVSSVFIIKNLYSLIHAGALVERWQGVSHYPKGTLFSETVPPADWYGLTKEQWRVATKETISLQAKAGRSI